jgi:hypothetical protein
MFRILERGSKWEKASETLAQVSRAVDGTSKTQALVKVTQTVKFQSPAWAQWLMPVIPATEEAEVGESQSEAIPGKKKKCKTVSEKKKKTKAKRVGGVAQVVPA